MSPSPEDRRVQALSVAAAAVPFAFALIRAVTTRSDFRYFLVALAGLLGAAAALRAGRAYAASPAAAVTVAAGAFVAATVLSMLAALLIGTTPGPGMLVVASSFGACFAAGVLIHLLARGRRVGKIVKLDSETET